MEAFMTNTISKFRAWDVLGGGKLAVFFAAMFLLPAVAHALVTGSPHDFTDNGFTGGICAACHIPHGADVAAERLYPRPGRPDLAPNAPARLCKDCHNGEGVGGVGTLPTGPGWPAVWIGNPPPALPAGHSDAACATTYENCTACHNHVSGFLLNVCDCLSCHNNLGSGAGSCAPPDIDSLFYGIGGVDDSGILSQHNIKYDTNADLCYKENNECWKCHPRDRGWDDRCVGPTDPDPPAQHPSAASYIYYGDDPDGAGSLAECTEIAKTTDKSLYQDFCFACHDGVEASASLADDQFNGSIPAAPAEQVPPTDRSNPAIAQAGPPWSTPPVPAKNSNIAGYVNPNPNSSGVPYFAYYEINGHGTDERVSWKYFNDGNSSNPTIPDGPKGVMNVTCLGGGIGMGCHEVHGSTNRFLIDDQLQDINGSDVLGLKTVEDFGSSFCYTVCHTADMLGAKNSTTDNMFHNFLSWNTYADEVSKLEVLHDTTTGSQGGWATWSITGDQDNPVRGTVPSFYIAGPISSASGLLEGVLPFYPSEFSEIQERSYPTSLPSAGGNVFFCITCHDPHGTSPTNDNTLRDGAMTRFLRNPDPGSSGLFSYSDPLCKQCHKKTP